MLAKRLKVAVTGAAGQISYALLFRIASGAMFGPETEVDLQLIELESGMPTLRGVAMELDDCAFPLLRSVLCTSDINAGMTGVNWAILVGAMPRKAGMERSDLLNINGSIFTAQGRAINDHAAKDVQVLVVGNPCNTNCLIAMHNAPNIPKNRFFAMTMLDENRAKSQLAIKAGVPITAVTNMAIWGNHSATQYPNFEQAKISGKKATEVISDLSWLQDNFIPTIQKRGAAVIAARGASSAASAAAGVVDTVYNLCHDTPEHETFSVSFCSEGQYGIEPGLIFSMPCQMKNGKLHVVENQILSEYSKKMIQITQDELLKERDMVRELKLIP